MHVSPPTGRQCSNSGCRGTFSLLFLRHRPWPLSQSRRVQTYCWETHRYITVSLSFSFIHVLIYTSFSKISILFVTYNHVSIVIHSGITPPVDFEEEVIHDPNGETLTLEAKMQPLLLESMTKSKDGFLGVRQEKMLQVFFIQEVYCSFCLHWCAASLEDCLDESDRLATKKSQTSLDYTAQRFLNASFVNSHNCKKCDIIGINYHLWIVQYFFGLWVGTLWLQLIQNV